MKTPARHTCCGKRRAANAPVPHAERRADAACSFTCPLSGSRRTPQDGTCTAPTLGAGWCRVTPTSRGSTVSSTARLLRVFEPFPPASSPQQRQSRPAGPSVPPRRVNPATGGPASRRPPSCFALRRDRSAGLVTTCAKGHFHRAPNFWLRQRRKPLRSPSGSVLRSAAPALVLGLSIPREREEEDSMFLHSLIRPSRFAPNRLVFL